jgi:hypothetical protein
MLQAANNIGLDSTLDLNIYALGIAGLILLFMGIAGFGATAGSRVLSVVVGVVFLAYGVYLAFIFDGGKYWITYYVYVLPLVVIYNAIRSAKASRDAAKQQQQQPPQYPQQPPQYPQQPPQQPQYPQQPYN